MEGESRPDQFLVVVTAAERTLNTALSVRRCAAQCGLVWGSLFPTGTSAAELVAGRLERGVWYGIRNVFVSQTEWAQSQTGRGSDGLILTLLVRAVALNH